VSALGAGLTTLSTVAALVTVVYANRAFSEARHLRLEQEQDRTFERLVRLAEMLERVAGNSAVATEDWSNIKRRAGFHLVGLADRDLPLTREIASGTVPYTDLPGLSMEALAEVTWEIANLRDEISTRWWRRFIP
jgi:hypothetical protein